MGEKLLTHELRVGVWIIVSLAALNGALVHFAGTDLLVDVLGLAEDWLTMAYAAIGGAAGVNLYNTAVGEFGVM